MSDRYTDRQTVRTVIPLEPEGHLNGLRRVQLRATVNRRVFCRHRIGDDLE